MITGVYRHNRDVLTRAIAYNTTVNEVLMALGIRATPAEQNQVAQKAREWQISTTHFKTPAGVSAVVG